MTTEEGKIDEGLFLKNQLEQLIEYSNTDREIQKPQGDEGRLYSALNLQRIVGLLDFFFSLAEISPRALDLVAPALFPKTLQYLIELSVEGMPQIQILCHKLFQSMLRLEIPGQVFEDAVTLAKNRKVNNDLGQVQNEVARLLNQTNAVKFESSSFLQLIYSKIEESRLAIYSVDNENFHGQNAAIFE